MQSLAGFLWSRMVRTFEKEVAISETPGALAGSPGLCWTLRMREREELDVSMEFH
jgi:hypothetical protein